MPHVSETTSTAWQEVSNSDANFLFGAIVRAPQLVGAPGSLACNDAMDQCLGTVLYANDLHAFRTYPCEERALALGRTSTNVYCAAQHLSVFYGTNLLQSCFFLWYARGRFRHERITLQAFIKVAPVALQPNIDWSEL